MEPRIRGKNKKQYKKKNDQKKKSEPKIKIEEKPDKIPIPNHIKKQEPKPEPSKVKKFFGMKDTPTKKINPHKHKKATFHKIKEWYKEKKHMRKIASIKMELTNGFHDQFTVVNDNGSFRLKGTEYVLDPEFKYYDLSVKLWCWDFHEGISVPIKRKIDVSKIKNAMKQNKNIDNQISLSLNPAVLREFIESRVAEWVMKGAKLQDEWRQIKTVLYIILVISVIHLLLWMYRTGMLDQIKGSLPI